MSTHVVQLANLYTPTSGGLRTAIDRLRAGYRAAGHRTTLIVPGTADGTVREDEKGTVITIAGPIVPGSGGYRMISRMSAVRKMLASIEPTHLEISDKTTLIDTARWARHRGIPTVLFSHERLDAILAPVLPDWLPRERALRRYNRWLARQVDTVVGASRFSVKEFVMAGARNVRLVPLGVDLDTFRPAVASPDRKRSLQLVYAGRLSAEKRPELVIDAAATLGRWGFQTAVTIVGDGPRRDSMQRRSSALDVTFMGHIADRAHVGRLLADADIAVQPSPAETFSLVALEAMACGTPVVVSHHCGATDLLAPNAGLAAWPSGVSVARAIEDLAAIPRERREAAARRRAEEFTWKRTIDSMLEIHLNRARQPVST